MSILSAIRQHQITVIPAKMMIGIWFLTAASLWITAGVTWVSEFVALKLPAIAIICSVLLLIVGGAFLMNLLHRLSTLVAIFFYLIFIVLAGILLGNLFTWQGVATVLGITGAMFAASACMCWCVDMNPGSFRQIIMMIIGGVIIAIVVNNLLDCSLLTWFDSLFTVILWAVTAGCEKATLHSYVRKLYAADFYTMPRCILLGAITLYLSVIAFFRRLLICLLNLIPC